MLSNNDIFGSTIASLPLWNFRWLGWGIFIYPSSSKERKAPITSLGATAFAISVKAVTKLKVYSGRTKMA